MVNEPQFRRVRTPEGAAYYGLPIGSLIKPAAVKAIYKSKVSAGSSVPYTKALNDYLGEIGGEGDDGPEALSGPLSFQVGGETYTAPKGSRLFSVPGGPDIKYVLTPDGRVTPFTPDAQINLQSALGKSMRTILTNPEKLKSSKYEEETFTAPDAAAPAGPTSAADQPVGTKAVSRNGDFDLVKTEAGWEDAAFGIEVDDETVQALLDDGSLSVEAEPTEEDEQEASQAAADHGPLADWEKELLPGEPEPAAPEPTASEPEFPDMSETFAEEDEDLDEQAAASDDAMFGSEDADLEVEQELPPAAPVEPPAAPAGPLNTMEKAEFLSALEGFPVGKTLYATDDTNYTKKAGEEWESSKGHNIYPTASMWFISNALSEEEPRPEPAAPEPEKPKSKIKFKPSAAKSAGATTPFNTEVNAPLAPKATANSGATASAASKKNLDLESPEWNAPSVAAQIKAQPESDFFADVQVIPDGKMIPKAQIQAAVDGLEGHSGFQVAYGLKGLPEDSPFKDAFFVESIKDYASEAFPDLKPKPAFVAYLKQKLGVDPTPAKKSTGEKTITIGSANPKQVGVQGMDGGVFSVEEIQEAIDILEDFQGKVFKSALNKKGNALGTLDPTKIVGFDKDKQKMKKDFIALLKKKIPASAATPGPQPGVTEPHVAADMAALDAALGITTPDANDGQIVPFEEGAPEAPLTKPTLEMLEKVGDGSSMTVTWDGTDHEAEKVNDLWNVDGTGGKPVSDKSFHILINSEGTTVSDIQLFPKTAAEQIKTEGTFTEDDVVSAPVGTHVEAFDSAEGQSHLLHKVGPDQWKFKESTNDQPMDAVYSDDDMKAYIFNNQAASVFSFGPADSDFVKTAKPGKPAPAKVEPTQAKASTFAPVGAIVENKNGLWKKGEDGQWRGIDDDGELIDAGSTGYSTQEILAMDAPPPTPEPAPIEEAVVAPPLSTNNPSLLDVIGAPEGTQITVTSSDGEIRYFGKVGPDKWKELVEDGGEPYFSTSNVGRTDSQMHTLATNAGSGAYLAAPNPEANKPTYAQQAPAALKVNGPAPDKFKTGEADPEDVGAAPIGTSILLSAQGGGSDDPGDDYVLTRQPNGYWKVVKSDDPSVDVGEEWPTSKIKSWTLAEGVSAYWVDLSKIEEGGASEEITSKASPGFAKVGTSFNVVDTSTPGMYAYTVTKNGPNSWTITTSASNSVFPVGDQWDDKDVASIIGVDKITVTLAQETPMPSAPEPFTSKDAVKANIGTQIQITATQANGDPDTHYTLEKKSESEWAVLASDNKYVNPASTWYSSKVESWLDGGSPNISAVLLTAGPDMDAKKGGAAYGTSGHLEALWADKEAVVKIYPAEGKPITALPDSSKGHWIALQGDDSTQMSHEELSNLMVGEEGWVSFNGNKYTSPANDADATPASTPGAPAVTNPSGLVPGKYVSGGKAYMIVKADGKGLYVDSKGTVTALTTAKVKSNHAAGMNNYEGMPDVIPALSPKIEKKPATVDKVPDGTYFGGDPNDAKTGVYTVVNGEMTLLKAKTSTTGSTSKVGSNANNLWMENASTGAQMRFDYQSNLTYVKTEGTGASSWKNMTTGEPMPEDYFSAANSYYGNGYVTKEGQSSKGWVTAYVVSHGVNEPTVVSANKAKTLFATGKLLDMYGNSIVPDGHTGAVHLFGAQTTMPALAKAKVILEASEGGLTPKIRDQMAELGVKFSAPLLKKKKEADGAEGGTALKDLMLAQMDQFLDGVEIEETEGEGKEWFEFNGLGEAKYPAAQTAGSGYSKPEKNAWIKAASLSIGDGKIIGLNYQKMSTSEADAWINAFQEGKFKTIYNLDVTASTKPGAKPMLEGFKHPGSPENEETHKVVWQAAVEGEISALKQIPGTWTTGYGVQASVAEIHNYLIAAQMQNPTYLAVAEQRQWVKAHLAGNKAAVDQLSVTALTRSQQGKGTLSQPIAWTDDIKPAKVYDSLFDDTKYPTSGWYHASATEYFDDNQAELQSWFDASKNTMGTYANDSSVKLAAVQTYFSTKAEEEYQKSLIPVYTKKPIQTVKKGTHPISQWTDQWGNEYFFKPRSADAKFRADIEAAGNSLGRFWGFESAEPQIMQGANALDGQPYGLLMKGVPAVGDLMGVDFSTLTGAQIGDIASEHVLDWMLDNDDTKGDNALITPDGKIVGIDKGRTFYAYGHWDGLNPDGMNTNANVVYGQMLKAVESGKISKETADAAYLKMQKRIKRIQKSDDAQVALMVTGAMDHRTQGYKVPYKIDGKLVSQDLDGLIAAIEDRKARLDKDFEALWAKTYKKAGYGDLPEIPLKAIDGIISGFDDPDLTSQVLKAQAHAKVTLVGGSHVHGGEVMVWTDTDGKGNEHTEGRMYLSFRAQDKILETLKGMSVGSESAPKVDSGFFPDSLDKFWSPTFAGAKTINHHAADGEYNASTISSWEASAAQVEADLAAWSPDMKTTKVNDIEVVAFPSGASVPRNHLGQYKMLLEHYSTTNVAIRKGYEDKAKITPYVEQYKPVNIQPKTTLVSPDGGHAVQLAGDAGWLVTQSDGTVGIHKDDSPFMKGAKAGADGWASIPAPTSADPKEPGLKVTLVNETHDKKAELVESIKTMTETHTPTGSPGSEYKIQLPTGEVIYYRNSGQTNTIRSQSGMLSFRAQTGGDENTMTTSFERIQAALDTLGIGTATAEEEDAENIYWREMHDIFMNRNGTGATAAHKGVQADIIAKRTELKVGEPKYFLEDLTASFKDAAEEAAWWRALYSKHFGKATIDKVLTDRTYLPKFDHYKLEDPELETGHAYWERFDVSLADIYATGKILGSTSSSEPTGKVLSGGSIGAEERLRLLGIWKQGMSATTDQGYGSAHNVYTRVLTANSSSYGSFGTYYDPRATLRTRSYSFRSDEFGRLDSRGSNSPMTPHAALKAFDVKNDGSNETMLPHGASLLDTVEVYVFSSATERQKSIDYLKKRGITVIRGVAVEDRLVMKSNLVDAMAKVRAAWPTK